MSPSTGMKQKRVYDHVKLWLVTMRWTVCMRIITVDWNMKLSAITSYWIAIWPPKIIGTDLRLHLRLHTLHDTWQSVGTTVFRGNFFQILRLTTASFPRIVINFLWPPEPNQIIMLYLLPVTANHRYSLCTKLTGNISDKNTFCGTRYLSHCWSLHGTVLLSRR